MERIEGEVAPEDPVGTVVGVGMPLSPAEVEFLSEETMVQITPSFTMGHLQCMKAVYGPFRPQLPVEVPLWLAITLKKRRKCKILTPVWLESDFLQSVLQREKAEKRMFDPSLPYHWMEIASQLLEIAADDIREVHSVRTLLQDIADVRFQKVRAGMLELKSHTPAVKLNGLSAMEVTSIRKFFTESMNEFYILSREADEAALEGQRRSGIRTAAPGRYSGCGGGDRTGRYSAYGGGGEQWATRVRGEGRTEGMPGRPLEETEEESSGVGRKLRRAHHKE